MKRVSRRALLIGGKATTPSQRRTEFCLRPLTSIRVSQIRVLLRAESWHVGSYRFCVSAPPKRASGLATIRRRTHGWSKSRFEIAAGAVSPLAVVAS